MKPASLYEIQSYQKKADTLLKYYQSGEYDKAETLGISITHEYPNNPFGWKLLGVMFQSIGRINQSVNSFKKYLEIEPLDIQIHNNLGVLLTDSNRLSEAEKSFKKAIKLKPDYANAYNNLGLTLKKLGNLEDSKISLKKAIELKPNFVEALCNLGDTLRVLNELDESKKILIQAISLRPNYANAYSNLGVTLKQLGKLEDSVLNLNEAIALKPDFFEAYNNLGVTLSEQGKLQESELSFKKAIQINSNYSDAYNNMSVILLELGKLEEAETSSRQSIALHPLNAQAYNNLCTILNELGEKEEAETQVRKSIEINPNLVESYVNLGLTLQNQKRMEEAEFSLKKAITLKPDFAETYNILAGLLHSRGLVKESHDYYLKAISLNPKKISYRWDFAINQISKVYTTHKNYKSSIHRFEKEISKLEYFINKEKLDEVVKVIGKSYPYYLAYFENDNKLLLKKYNKICHDIMKRWQSKNRITLSNSIINKDPSEKIKIGIISAHIFYHSVWNAFLKGIIQNLDTKKFEIHIFSLSTNFDDETKIAKKKVKNFYSSLGGITQWANKIQNSKVDIAFYPEIGMNQKTIQLANMRLAPVQVCSWGHPETSGIPTIDYYISSELLETSNSKTFYTEKLIKLPGIGYYFDPPTLESSDINFTKIGIKNSLPILLCLGSPNKFSPFYDWVFIEIIKRMKNCQIVFMNDTDGASEILKKRLKFSIREAGLNFKNNIIFIPQQSRKGYSSLMKNADVLLDTIGFSGMNTAMQAIGCGLPIVTREGKFQRTRHASAILKTLEIDELIAKNEEEYIDLVEKLICDQEFRSNIKLKIKENENYLYRNKKPIRALEDFFQSIGGF